MNTEQDTQAQENVAPALEAGTLLKNKRESLGLTQKQISDRLKLRVTLIQQIEENQFESDQVATFMRGYIRSYAKYVNLDEKVVLSALHHAGDAQHQEQEMLSFSRKTKTEKHNSRIMILTWSIFAVIAGISSLWWWQNQQQDTLSQSLANTESSEELAVEESLAPEFTSLEVIEAEQNEAGASVVEGAEGLAAISDAEESSDAVTPADETSAQQTTETEPTAEAAANAETVEASTAPEAVANELVMQFTADCWIQVKDATGKTLSTGIKKAGQSLNLSGTAPYKVILGAPEGVSMTFASEPVDLSGYTSGKVARITLP
ncbi:cytoskeleton protein RodZ [Vibrio sp. 10N.222.51.C8]|uniref:cytoskeleton protein RodZ n=1 Tax=unclassified Vibrio TaxID=2614977 RepID=UPI000315446D|nr:MULTISPECIES: cytoskeleton protein RodZ [unclassified Vibrio]ANP77401.1 transcriptional regulator [Vibrio crassostreae 9CS106]PMK22908.1 transcriptional regulator [Vibrio sp. 10N.261.54.C3]PMN94154.1 transcriptional regulator [Vibrio sp. 10N.222.55.F9]PMO00835.1 transcriptional regulator [Vibrio sp. 10N.222.55.C12]PMO12130.1 transcriptional regulator [Vibrio sp. 10N.222.54.F10]